MSETKRALMRALLEGPYENVNRREAWTVAALDADRLLRRFGPMVTERNVEEFAQLVDEEVRAA